MVFRWKLSCTKCLSDKKKPNKNLKTCCILLENGGMPLRVFIAVLSVLLYFCLPTPQLHATRLITFVCNNVTSYTLDSVPATECPSKSGCLSRKLNRLEPRGSETKGSQNEKKQNFINTNYCFMTFVTGDERSTSKWAGPYAWARVVVDLSPPRGNNFLNFAHREVKMTKEN